MKLPITLSIILLGTCSAFIPSPLMRGTIHQALPRAVQSSCQPQLKRMSTASGKSSSVLNSFLSDRFYEFRASHLGFASKDSVKEAASNPSAVFLDVRSKAEIANASLKTDKPVVHAECGSLDECAALEKLPKKKDSPIIVFCASGKRASNAKQVLESQGYRNVLNAGGLGDLEYL